MCDPVNTCHSVALRDCLGRKKALYKYLILYFFTFTTHSSFTKSVMMSVVVSFAVSSEKSMDVGGISYISYHLNKC